MDYKGWSGAARLHQICGVELHFWEWSVPKQALNTCTSLPGTGICITFSPYANGGASALLLGREFQSFGVSILLCCIVYQYVQICCPIVPE